MGLNRGGFDTPRSKQTHRQNHLLLTPTAFKKKKKKKQQEHTFLDDEVDERFWNMQRPKGKYSHSCLY